MIYLSDGVPFTWVNSPLPGIAYLLYCSQESTCRLPSSFVLRYHHSLGSPTRQHLRQNPRQPSCGDLVYVWATGNSTSLFDTEAKFRQNAIPRQFSFTQPPKQLASPFLPSRFPRQMSDASPLCSPMEEHTNFPDGAL